LQSFFLRAIQSARRTSISKIRAERSAVGGNVTRSFGWAAKSDVTFGADVVAVGEVRVTGPRHIPDGEVLGD